MLAWILNTETPQTADTLRAELEQRRDHFVRTHHPDVVVQQMNDSYNNSSGGARQQIKKALDSYLSAKPTTPQLQRAEEQMNGAIEAAVALAMSMTRGLRNARLQASLFGHVDDNRQDGIDQRSGVHVDFAPMPRMPRESFDDMPIGIPAPPTPASHMNDAAVREMANSQAPRPT